MVITPQILKDVPPVVAGLFRRWQEYLYLYVDFSMPDSEIHAYAHSERVLLHSLCLVYDIMGADSEALDILAHAALFHDTRRLDDYLDTGHGARGAVAYEKYCATHSALTRHPESAILMRYHDIDDSLGLEAIRKQFGADSERVSLLYSIFKDADALDRWRLGSCGLDSKYLRTDAAKRRVDYSRRLVDITTDPFLLNKIDQLVRSTLSQRLLLVIDPQVDFITGSLPVPGAVDAMAALAQYILSHAGRYKVKVVTADRHPACHCSFTANGGEWPTHCVSHTPGAEIDAAVSEALYSTPGRTFVFAKGESTDTDQYSIFDNREAADVILRIVDQCRINTIDVCGLAGDVCVLASLRDAMRLMPQISFRLLEAFTPSIDGGKTLSDFANLNNILCDR